MHTDDSIDWAWENDQRRCSVMTLKELSLYVYRLSSTGYQVYWALRHYAMGQPLHARFCIDQARYQRRLADPALCQPIPLP